MGAMDVSTTPLQRKEQPITFDLAGRTFRRPNLAQGLVMQKISNPLFIAQVSDADDNIFHVRSLGYSRKLTARVILLFKERDYLRASEHMNAHPNAARWRFKRAEDALLVEYPGVGEEAIITDVRGQNGAPLSLDILKENGLAEAMMAATYDEAGEVSRRHIEEGAALLADLLGDDDDDDETGLRIFLDRDDERNSLWLSPSAWQIPLDVLAKETGLTEIEAAKKRGDVPLPISKYMQDFVHRAIRYFEDVANLAANEDRTAPVFRFTPGSLTNLDLPRQSILHAIRLFPDDALVSLAAWQERTYRYDLGLRPVGIGIDPETLTEINKLLGKHSAEMLEEDDLDPWIIALVGAATPLLREKDAAGPYRLLGGYRSPIRLVATAEKPRLIARFDYDTTVESIEDDEVPLFTAGSLATVASVNPIVLRSPTGVSLEVLQVLDKADTPSIVKAATGALGWLRDELRMKRMEELHAEFLFHEYPHQHWCYTEEKRDLVALERALEGNIGTLSPAQYLLGLGFSPKELGLDLRKDPDPYDNPSHERLGKIVESIETTLLTWVRALTLSVMEDEALIDCCGDPVGGALPYVIFGDAEPVLGMLSQDVLPFLKLPEPLKATARTMVVDAWKRRSPDIEVRDVMFDQESFDAFWKKRRVRPENVGFNHLIEWANSRL